MGDDLIRSFGLLYQKMLNERRNEDYEVNPEQMDKFLEIYHFFGSKVDEEYDDGIEPIYIEPKEEHGGLNVGFCVFDVHGDEIGKLAKLISYCSAISIDVVDESQICISMTIPNIYKRKEANE